MTTYRAFVDGLEALTVTGVVHAFTSGPPASLPTAQLPAMWVDFPGEGGRTEDGWTFQAEGGWPALKATVVIAYEAVEQGLRGVTFDGVVDMVDNLATALHGATTLTKGSLKFTITPNVQIAVGTFLYWGLVATVEGTG